MIRRKFFKPRSRKLNSIPVNTWIEVRNLERKYGLTLFFSNNESDKSVMIRIKSASSKVHPNWNKIWLKNAKMGFSFFFQKKNDKTYIFYLGNYYPDGTYLSGEIVAHEQSSKILANKFEKYLIEAIFQIDKIFLLKKYGRFLNRRQGFKRI